MSLLNSLLQSLNPLSRYKQIWAIGRRYSWSAPIVAIGGLICSALEGLSISLLIPLLGVLMATPTAAKTSEGSEGALAVLNRFAEMIPTDHRLPIIAGVMLLLVVVKGVAASLNSLFIGWVDGLAAHDVRRGMARLMVDVGYPFYLKNDPAELLTILSSQSWSATEAIRTVFAMVADVVAVVVFTGLLVMVDWRLTLIALALILPVTLSQNLFRERIRRMGERVSKANHWLGERMLLLVDAFRMIKVFGQEEREFRAFSNASAEVRKSGLSAEMFGVWFGPTMDTLHASVFVAILLGAYWAQVPGPVLLAFLVLLYRLQPYVQSIEGARLSLGESQTALDEVEWLLDPADKPPAPGGRIRFTTLEGPIVFENVSFTYDTRPGQPALEGVSLAFQPGRCTALIGRSGSGKTTLVNLICRLLHPTSGRILVAGKNLSDIDPVSWRAHLGFAGQDAELVDGTIAENIAYGLPEASLEMIREAAQLADIDAFVEDLDEGYATRVGARGLSLSGGQRQRIGLARALVRRPSVLVLDEATNAIDGVSEQAILNVVRKRNLTAIVVSHRASALSYCDLGVVIDRGRVVEAGALADLKAYRLMQELAPA